ncbi:MAG: pyridoxal-phosphate dependent enzyme [Candidatus Helarchaeota archaeon]|nr:pyridoxal-phosphate dependent enzyme [Candidatus Helarchaeota archaeon]
MKKPFLFEVYPDLENSIAWLPLINKTKVHKLKALGEYLGTNDLWIKRDDQTTEIYGGNKPRKLEFLFADAKKKNKDPVITIGGLGSNHCLATSIFGQQLGFKVVLILFNQPLTSDVQKKLLLFQYFKTEMLHEEIIKKDQGLLKRYPNSYFITGGGSDQIGIIGFVNAAFELKNQVEQGEMPLPKYVFLALGSGGTLAGLEIGIKLANINTKVIGVRVIDKSTTSSALVKSLFKKTLKNLKIFSDKIPDIQIQKSIIIDDFYGGEYGKVTKEGLKALQLMEKYENIELDTTYTAKTFAAMINFIKKENFKKPILFWNTYNSVDLSQFVKKLKFEDYKSLPKDFHPFFKKRLKF